VIIFGACAERRVLEFDLVLRSIRLNDANPIYMKCKKMRSQIKR